MNYIYLPDRKYNMNAIDFYIKILEDAFRNKGEEVKRVSNLDTVKKGDSVVVIAVNDFVRVFLKKRVVKTFVWFQGIVPEEMSLNLTGWKRFKAKTILTILEKITLCFSTGNIFVSEAMAAHYKEKYGYNKNNYTIMPCFNQSLNKAAFAQSKYEKPSFVYTGSLAKWQCFDKTIDIFLKIRESMPSATLAIYTGSVEEAKVILAKKGLEDVNVKNVSYNELENEIQQYKYGFLIRENIKLNNVATPTKMSSYLGCGIIPVFSPCIRDFDKQFGQKKYFVRAQTEEEIISKVIELESEDIKSEDVLKEYSEIFDSYYSKDKYIRAISQFYNK